MTDREGITKELRKYADNYPCVSPKGFREFADRIDARFSDELTAKQEQVDELQARLDASIQPPVDIDGARWTGDDVDKPFAPSGVLVIAAEKDQVLREIAYDWPRDGWWLVDQDGTHYPAEKCLHLAPTLPETIEDVRAYIRNIGWRFQDLYDCAKRAVDDAYECGRRDGDKYASGGYVSDPSVIRCPDGGPF